MFGDTGWKCPECGRCYAPWVRTCDTCGGRMPTIPVSECQHVWGIMTTLGQACIECGQLDNRPRHYNDGKGHRNCNISNCPICNNYNKGGTS